MKAGIEAFLDECAEPELRQIALHDAPAVLGWDRWREIGAANGLGLIEASLAAAIEAGEIRELPVKPMAHLLLGALDEAAMLVARSEDPASRAEVTTVLLALLESFAVARPRLGAPRRRRRRSRSRRRGRAGATPSARTCARRPAASRRSGCRPRPGSSTAPQAALSSKPGPARGQRFGGPLGDLAAGDRPRRRSGPRTRRRRSGRRRRPPPTASRSCRPSRSSIASPAGWPKVSL